MMVGCITVAVGIAGWCAFVWPTYSELLDARRHTAQERASLALAKAVCEGESDALLKSKADFAKAHECLDAEIDRYRHSRKEEYDRERQLFELAAKRWEPFAEAYSLPSAPEPFVDPSSPEHEVRRRQAEQEKANGEVAERDYRDAMFRWGKFYDEFKDAEDRNRHQAWAGCRVNALNQLMLTCGQLSADACRRARGAEIDFEAVHRQEVEAESHLQMRAVTGLLAGTGAGFGTLLTVAAWMFMFGRRTASDSAP
jgi:hypothetical protein